MIKNGKKQLKSFIRNFQYMSDIHLEYRDGLFDIPIISKNLILAGDIGNPFKTNYYDFLLSCSYKYEYTFVVLGNHEYWGSNMSKTHEQVNIIFSKFKNVFLLDNSIVETDNFVFMGCTLWSKILNEPLNIQGDEYNITIDDKNITWNDLNRLHNEDVNWLTNALGMYNEKNIVVITHHVPTYKLVHPYYDIPKFKKYSDRFYTNLEHLIKPPVSTWICGHSHCNMNIEINDVNLHINAIGYPSENEKKYLNDKLRIVKLKS